MRILKPLLITIVASGVVLLPTKPQMISHPASITPIVSAPKLAQKLPAFTKHPPALLASKVTTKAVEAPKQASGGSHTDWMTQAGIPQNEQAAAEQLVQRESSWNPNAMNSIGACSLVQALPCSKIQGDWRDPVTALKWGNGYVKGRYGTWNAALSHSLQNSWY